MIAFVKSIRDFSTLAAAQVVSWDLPLATSGDDTGSVVLLGESAAGREGNWLAIDRRIYLISQTAYNKGLTTLTLQMPVNAFDRGIYYGVRWNKLDDMPAGYRKMAQRYVEAGALKGKSDGSLDLSEDMLRVMEIMRRYFEGEK